LFTDLPPQVPALIERSNSVSQITDIHPNHWAFIFFKKLLDRYSTSSVSLGDRSLNSTEFSILLSRFIRSCDHCNFSFEERRILQRLQRDFPDPFSIRVDSLDTKITTLESSSFTPTTTLSGEVIIGISSPIGAEIHDTISLQQRVKLDLDTSFTGQDRLRISAVAGSAEQFSYVGKVTNEGRLGFDTNTENRLKINHLSYRFPVLDNLTAFVAPVGDDVNPVNTIMSSRGQGSISRFGRKNPIYRLIETGGIGLSYAVNEAIDIGVGYYGGELAKPTQGNGFLQGDYSLAMRVKAEFLDEKITLGVLYIHSYNDSNLATGTGSLASQIDLDRPMTGNSYGLEASLQITPNFSLGGWLGLTEATVLHLGQAEVWNHAITLGFTDVGKEDSLLGIIIGQEPKLTGTSGFLIDGKRRDPSTSLHIEGFYRYPLSDNLSITPGFIWITAPNHDASNPAIFVFTIRSTLRF
jgi:Carbohydrate-selective porin, OprB family